MSKLNQRGAIQFLVLILLFLGIVGGVYLVQQRTNLLPKAQTGQPLRSDLTFGKALKISNIGDTRNNYIKIPNHSSLNPADKITIEMWVKPPSEYRNQRLLTKTINARQGNNNIDYIVTQYGFGLGDYGSSQVVLMDLQLSPFRSLASGAQYLEGSYQDSGWYHFALTYDQQTGIGQQFVNGVLAGTNSGLTNSLETRDNGDLYIGLPDDIFPSPTYAMKGTEAEIDEVRISKVARYAGNFTPVRTAFANDSNTLALYHFNENANDSSGNNNHGQIFGEVSFVDSTIAPTPAPTPVPSPTGGPVIDLPYPLPDIPLPFPQPSSIPTPMPTPLPTLAPGNSNSWGTVSEVTCENGTTPQKPERTRLVYTVWPDEPYDLNNPVKFRRTEFSYDEPEVQIISIQNRINSSAAYVGIETESGQFLEPKGDLPHEKMDYSNFFGLKMVRWFKGTVPPSFYTIEYQAPDNWCE